MEAGKTVETAVLIETVEAGKAVETAVLTETVETGETVETAVLQWRQGRQWRQQC